jgi:hypothetical protein
MKVFWSWQDDYSPKTCRHFIREALVEAIDAVGDELGLDDSERPEIDHDTKDTPGMAEITKTILEKISRCAVFVADLTPVGGTEKGKALPNPNVLIELGWAHNKPGPDKFIGVLNTASGWKPEHVPFDVRHRRVLPYELAETADAKTKKEVKKKLVKDITGALRINLGLHVREVAAAQDIKGVPAQADDRSIWATASSQFEHSDAFAAGPKKSVSLPKGPRGYIRIIPAGWKNGPPNVHDISKLDTPTVWVQAEGTSSGDFGACKEGFVRYWITRRSPDGQVESKNVAMYFDETGEFWFLHGMAIGEADKGSILRVESLVQGWSIAMKAALEVFENFNCLPVAKIEAGLVGADEARWPGQWGFNSPPPRKGSCVIQRQQRDWTEEKRMAFLVDAFSAVRDLYGFPRASAGDVRKLIGA